MTQLSETALNGQVPTCILETDSTATTVTHRPETKKLVGLEMARGLAAFAVVAFHANAAASQFGAPSIEWLTGGFHGVDFFFLLSGFIIFYSHAGDIEKPARTLSYLKKRIIRLFPILWIVVIGFFIIRWGLLQKYTTVSTIYESLFLYPSLELPSPSVIWTLRHEVLFYTVFISFLFSRKIGVTVFAIWTIGVISQMVLVAFGRPFQGLLSFFLSSFELDFILGAILAFFYRRKPFRRNILILPISIIFLLLLLFIEFNYKIYRYSLTDYVSLAATFWTLVFGLSFFFIIFGILSFRMHQNSWLILLGSASYSIYLVHTPINSIAQRIAVKFPAFFDQIGGGQLFLVACGVGGGIALHVFFERPLTRWLRSSFL